jgi:glycosyltransferase involved in cell wall biosynthesis
MKILLVGDYPNDPRLGSAKVPHKLAEEFRALGHQCDLLFADDLGPTPRGGHLRHLCGPRLAARAVRRAFDRNGPYDVVDIASGDGLAFGRLRRRGAYPGTAFISRSHGLEHLNYRRMLDDHDAGLLHKPWYKRIAFPLIRLRQVAASARLADRLIVLNPGDRAFALQRRWLPADRVVVVGHGVSARFLADAPAPDAPRGGGILFCGTWNGMKGIDYLVQFFTRLVRGGRRDNLTLVGVGVDPAVVRAAFPADVADRLTILHRVSEDEVMAHYRRHDVFVLPSTYEGFGMVVLEAMSQRLPVVATPVGCVPSLIRDGETGRVVPCRDAAALADAVRDLLSHESLRHRLADQAVERVRGKTWRRTAEQTLAVYDSALESRNAPAA